MYILYPVDGALGDGGRALLQLQIRRSAIRAHHPSMRRDSLHHHRCWRIRGTRMVCLLYVFVSISVFVSESVPVSASACVTCIYTCIYQNV